MIVVTSINLNRWFQ